MSNVFGQVASNLTATQKAASRTNLDLDDVTETRVAGIEGDISAIQDGSGLANSGYGLGVNQNYTTLTGVRTSGTTYTNTTGKPILVSVWANATATAEVDGDGVSISEDATAGNNALVWFLVPNGSTYRVTSGAVPLNWVELR